MRLIDPKNISAKRYKEACEDFECGWNACINEIMECVQQIEAEPVRHGTWVLEKIIYDQDLFRCSECGRKELVYNRHSHDMAERYPYCHCGAKMDGGVKE